MYTVTPKKGKYFVENKNVGKIAAVHTNMAKAKAHAAEMNRTARAHAPASSISMNGTFPRPPKPQGRGIVKALGQQKTTGHFAQIEKEKGKGAAIGALQNKLAKRRGQKPPYTRAA